MSIIDNKWLWTKIQLRPITATIKPYPHSFYDYIVYWSDLTQPTTHKADEIEEWIESKWFIPLSPLLERLLER